MEHIGDSSILNVVENSEIYFHYFKNWKQNWPFYHKHTSNYSYLEEWL